MRSNPKRLIDQFFEMQKEIDSLFDDFMRPSQSLTTETSHWRPPMDIYETVDHFVIKVEIAGIKPDEDVSLHLDGNVLTIEGYRQDRTSLKKEHYHQAELNYGPFKQSIVLPDILAEEVEPMAKYENGFLEVYIPKAKQNPPKKISVQVREKLETAEFEDITQKELDDDDAE